MIKADDRVKNFINELEKNKLFDESDISRFRMVYSLIKPEVCEDLYMDIISSCVTTALSAKGEGKEMNVPSLCSDVRNALGLVDYKDNEIMSLRDVRGTDEAVTDHAMMGQIIEKLKCSKDLENAVFLDILNGEDINVVARKYRLSKEVVSEIYENRLAYVESILVVDDKVVIEDINSRDGYTSNIKIVTGSIK